MAKKNSINVALVGRGFMGRTHSNAWGQVNRFCNPPIKAVLHTACDNVADGAEDYCQMWGWQKFEQDFSKVCKDSEVDLVDLGTPNYIHAPMAIEALHAGKHVACEKPLAGTLEDASKMVDAAASPRPKLSYGTAIVVARRLHLRTSLLNLANSARFVMFVLFICRAGRMSPCRWHGGLTRNLPVAAHTVT